MKKASSQVASAFKAVDKNDAEKVRTFIGSPEAQSIVRQLFSFHLSPKGGANLGQIRKVFQQSLCLAIGGASLDIDAISSTLFEALENACNQALEMAIEKGAISLQSAASAYRTRMVLDELANVGNTLAFLASSPTLDLRATLEFEKILHLPSLKKRFSNSGGTLDFFRSDADIKELFPGKDYDRQKFSFQLSDHFPVWVQIKTDIDGERLNQIVQDSKKS